MNDLISYKNAQIDALQREVARLKEENIQLGTWVFELCQDETPVEYRQVIREELHKYY